MSFSRKLERRPHGLNENVFRDRLAAGFSELEAQYAAYAASHGERGCWKSDRKVARELPPGRRGPHHAEFAARASITPSSEFWRRIPPLGELPGKKKLRSLHGAVHVVFLPFLRAAQRRRQREAKPPGLIEHEERMQNVTSAVDALAALGWSPRGPPR